MTTTNMPIKKWILQYVIATVICFILFAAVQYLKGRGIEYSINFGLLWSFLAVTVFFIRRVYNYRKNISCGICNDIPKK
jgi:hypothetical protein